METPPKQLDREFLQAMYGDMPDAEKEIFEMFFTETGPAITEIIDLITGHELETAARKIHSVIPSFTLVGLPQLTSQLREVEFVVNENIQSVALRSMKEFSEEYTTYLPLLTEEYERVCGIVKKDE